MQILYVWTWVKLPTLSSINDLCVDQGSLNLFVKIYKKLIDQSIFVGLPPLPLLAFFCFHAYIFHSLLLNLFTSTTNKSLWWIHFWKIWIWNQYLFCRSQVSTEHSYGGLFSLAVSFFPLSKTVTFKKQEIATKSILEFITSVAGKLVYVRNQ